MPDANVRARFRLPVWYRDRLSPTCVVDRVMWRGGAWFGVFADGSETVDFGLRSEALACASYFARIRSR